MAEDSAYLVSPCESARNSIPEEPKKRNTKHPKKTGDVLVGFHEDAMCQAQIGNAQALLFLFLGLGISADCGLVSLLDFILPLAEVHLCFDETDKKWLVSLTYLALAGGSFSWGLLGDHVGRKRALLSALLIAILFSGVATVMPTSGTFMTAWFCASLGISGFYPLSCTYMAESCNRSMRDLNVGLIQIFWPLGAVFVSALAEHCLPMKGVDIVKDNMEHWSSWHRFLILSIVPILLSLFGHIWTSESPRYLLEASREVEALAVYQRFHKMNNGSKKNGLTELELPARSAYRDKSCNPGRSIFKHYLFSFQEIVQKISTPSQFRVTLVLAALHLMYGFVYMGVSTFSVAIMKDLRNQEFFTNRTYIQHEYYFNMEFNSSIENTEYKFTTFKNVTFNNISLSHVLFKTCMFYDSEFINVMSSKTYFQHATVNNCRFVDTDLSDHHFMDSSMSNNTFISLIFDCPADFDYNTFLTDLYFNTLDWAQIMCVMQVLVGMALGIVKQKSIIIRPLTVTCCFISVLMFYMTNGFILGIVQYLMRTLIMGIVTCLSICVIEAYPCHLRCTAHGFMRCLYHVASLCAIIVFESLIDVVLLFPTIITLVVMLAATYLTTKMEDNHNTLL